MSSDETVSSIYIGIVWFIGLSVLWLIIFNYIKTAKVKSFFIVFGVILVLLMGISSYTAVMAFKENKQTYVKATSIGSLSAHILFAIYSFYTGLSSANPFNTNQKVVVYASPSAANASAQKGGKSRK